MVNECTETHFSWLHLLWTDERVKEKSAFGANNLYLSMSSLTRWFDEINCRPTIDPQQRQVKIMTEQDLIYEATFSQNSRRRVFDVDLKGRNISRKWSFTIHRSLLTPNELLSCLVLSPNGFLMTCHKINGLYLLLVVAGIAFRGCNNKTLIYQFSLSRGVFIRSGGVKPCLGWRTSSAGFSLTLLFSCMWDTRRSECEIWAHSEWISHWPCGEAPSVCATWAKYTKESEGVSPLLPWLWPYCPLSQTAAVSQDPLFLCEWVRRTFSPHLGPSLTSTTVNKSHWSVCVY